MGNPDTPGPSKEAILAGMLIRVRRMVPVVALVRVPPAMVAAARVRLKAMHANTSHALFAENRPEVILRWTFPAGL